MAFDAQLLQRCWFLTGPTASGKTAAGIELARLLGAEIVALDSMTIYRGLDIGTAKATTAERQAVPHHLLDIRDPHEEFSLAEYLLAAESVCRDILYRNRVPLFVGGTGLYLRGVLRGVFSGPPANWELRARWQQFAAEHGPAALHQQLQRVDPVSAARLPPQDERRIIRALEVHALTGQPLSVQQREQPRPLAERPRHVYWLNPPRPWLHDRINRRVLAMLEAGFVAEVRALEQNGPPLGPTAAQALGYREISRSLAGACSLESATTEIQLRTRQFAKRQCTWFRNLEECHPFPLTGTESPAEIAHRLWALGEFL